MNWIAEWLKRRRFEKLSPDELQNLMCYNSSWNEQVKATARLVELDGKNNLYELLCDYLGWTGSSCVGGNWHVEPEIKASILAVEGLGILGYCNALKPLIKVFEIYEEVRGYDDWDYIASSFMELCRASAKAINRIIEEHPESGKQLSDEDVDRIQLWGSDPTKDYVSAFLNESSIKS